MGRARSYLDSPSWHVRRKSRKRPQHNRRLGPYQRVGHPPARPALHAVDRAARPGALDRTVRSPCSRISMHRYAIGSHWVNPRPHHALSFAPHRRSAQSQTGRILSVNWPGRSSGQRRLCCNSCYMESRPPHRIYLQNCLSITAEPGEGRYSAMGTKKPRAKERGADNRTEGRAQSRPDRSG